MPLAISASHGIATETLVERISDWCREAGFRPPVRFCQTLL